MFPSIAHAQTFMPPVGTQTAANVDSLYAFLLWSSLISFIILIGGMTYFIYKYKRRTDTDKTAYITHNTTLEFLWSFIPFVIFMFVAVWGIWIYYGEMRHQHEDALEVQVYAKKWEWKFVYKNGKEVVNEYGPNGEKTPATAVLPVGRPIRLVMTSQEAMDEKGNQTAQPVIHSFFIPAYRIKQDVLPGKFSTLNFIPEKVGEFYVFCAEYCGANHSNMLAKLKIVSEEEYSAWMTNEAVTVAGELTPAQRGQKIYFSSGCVACHSVDGKPMTGPTWKGLFGHNVELAAGGTTPADENYLRESILNPNAKIVKGFQANMMPAMAGILKDEQVNDLIEYIKTLK